VRSTSIPNNIHITLVMLAQGFLKVICAQSQQASAPETSPPMPDSVPALPLTLPTQAPLTVPEVRHLLGHLIWPSACHARLVLAWSSWRRWHRSVASYYHTKRRLEAG
jgi:hypothetical protein